MDEVVVTASRIYSPFTGGGGGVGGTVGYDPTDPRPKKEAQEPKPDNAKKKNDACKACKQPYLPLLYAAVGAAAALPAAADTKQPVVLAMVVAAGAIGGAALGFVSQSPVSDFAGAPITYLAAQTATLLTGHGNPFSTPLAAVAGETVGGRVGNTNGVFTGTFLAGVLEQSSALRTALVARNAAAAAQVVRGVGSTALLAALVYAASDLLLESTVCSAECRGQ